MPERETIEQAQEDALQGKSPSTQAGEFVREELHHVREGKHGVRSPEQAIAIGLSKARRAGVKLGVPKGPAAVRRKAEQDVKAGENPRHKISRTRSRAASHALKRESKSAISRQALSRQSKTGSAKQARNVDVERRS
ncbi:MAG: DUF6496 domain-containing protein [Terriglobales bacterium]